LSDLKEFLKKHLIYFIGIGIITVLCVIVLILKPEIAAPPILDPSTYPYNLILFGLGLDTTILLWAIAGFLLYRWQKGGRSNTSLLVWGLVFFIYSSTFVAHIFRGWGFPWADERASEEIFFLWRFGMILWAGGSLYGILRILTENKKARIIPSIAIVVSGFFWFIYGLFFANVVNNIEYMMYGFLFTIWLPVCFSISYIFLLYGRKSGYAGPKLLFLGYLGLTITYMGWAPWHLNYFYFVWYFLFLLSLVPILIGFIVLSRETEGE